MFSEMFGDRDRRRRRSTSDPAAGAQARWRAVAKPLLFSGVLAMLWMFAGTAWMVVIGVVAGVLFMHELGHYLAARWAGMQVTEFFVGFGPRIWSFQRGETRYGVKAIWAGAYVRITGMSSAEGVPAEDEARAFRAKSYPKKLIVLVAGPATHFVLALVLLFAALSIDGGSGQDRRADHLRTRRLDAGDGVARQPGRDGGDAARGPAHVFRWSRRPVRSSSSGSWSRISRTRPPRSSTNATGRVTRSKSPLLSVSPRRGPTA